MRYLSALMAVLAFVAAAFVLSACVGGGGGSPPPETSVRLSCVDVTNSASRCAGKAAKTRYRDSDIGVASGFPLISSAHADTEIEAGTVTRAELITVASQVTNLTPTPFSGYIEARFDAGCNGATEWVILPKTPIEAPAGETVGLSVGGACGDMPTGARQLVATAYGPDGTTVVDRATVRFNLIE